MRAEGGEERAEGAAEHAEGAGVRGGGGGEHAEGEAVRAEGARVHAEGVAIHAEGAPVDAEGAAMHAEGAPVHAGSGDDQQAHEAGAEEARPLPGAPRPSGGAAGYEQLGRPCGSGTVQVLVTPSWVITREAMALPSKVRTSRRLRVRVVEPA